MNIIYIRLFKYIMEDTIVYWGAEIPKDYDSLLHDFIQLLEKHNRLVEKYNYMNELAENFKETND